MVGSFGKRSENTALGEVCWIPMSILPKEMQAIAFRYDSKGEVAGYAMHCIRRAANLFEGACA